MIVVVDDALWGNENVTLFTSLHAMQTRSSDENSVRLSVYRTRAL